MKYYRFFKEYIEFHMLYMQITWYTFILKLYKFLTVYELEKLLKNLFEKFSYIICRLIKFGTEDFDKSLLLSLLLPFSGSNVKFDRNNAGVSTLSRSLYVVWPLLGSWRVSDVRWNQQEQLLFYGTKALSPEWHSQKGWTVIPFLFFV